MGNIVLMYILRKKTLVKLGYTIYTVYKDFAIDVNLNELRCVPFENAPKSVKDFCVHTLHCVEGDHVFVLYVCTDDAPIPLGFYALTERLTLGQWVFDERLCNPETIEDISQYIRLYVNAFGGGEDMLIKFN